MCYIVRHAIASGIGSFIGVCIAIKLWEWTKDRKFHKQQSQIKTEVYDEMDAEVNVETDGDEE